VFYRSRSTIPQCNILNEVNLRAVLQALRPSTCVYIGLEDMHCAETRGLLGESAHLLHTMHVVDCGYGEQGRQTSRCTIYESVASSRVIQSPGKRSKHGAVGTAMSGSRHPLDFVTKVRLSVI
jgi:hypothetical protein